MPITKIVELTDKDLDIYSDVLEQFINYNLVARPIPPKMFQNIKQNSEELNQLIIQTEELSETSLNHARATVLEAINYMKPLSLDLTKLLKENYYLISKFLGIPKEEQDSTLEISLSNAEENNKQQPSLGMLLRGYRDKQLKQAVRDWRKDLKNTKPNYYDEVDNSIMKTILEGSRLGMEKANETDKLDPHGKLLNRLIADSLSKLHVNRLEEKRIRDNTRKIEKSRYK